MFRSRSARTTQILFDFAIIILIFFAKIGKVFKPTKFSSCFFRLTKNIVRAKIPAGAIMTSAALSSKGSDIHPIFAIPSWQGYPYKVNFSRKKVNHFRKVSQHSSDGKSRKDVWILKYCQNQIKPNSGKDTMLCFQISVFSLIFEGCVMRNFSLFIYINIFIYINNNIFSKMDASKTKLKSEIWKQKHILLSAFRFQFCF